MDVALTALGLIVYAGLCWWMGLMYGSKLGYKIALEDVRVMIKNNTKEKS